MTVHPGFSILLLHRFALFLIFRSDNRKGKKVEKMSSTKITVFAAVQCIAEISPECNRIFAAVHPL